MKFERSWGTWQGSRCCLSAGSLLLPLLLLPRRPPSAASSGTGSSCGTPGGLRSRRGGATKVLLLLRVPLPLRRRRSGPSRAAPRRGRLQLLRRALFSPELLLLEATTARSQRRLGAERQQQQQRSGEPLGRPLPLPMPVLLLFQRRRQQPLSSWASPRRPRRPRTPRRWPRPPRARGGGESFSSFFVFSFLDLDLERESFGFFVFTRPARAFSLVSTLFSWLSWIIAISASSFLPPYAIANAAASYCDSSSCFSQTSGSPIRSTYACIASSLLMPASLAQWSYLARASRERKPGRSPWTSPRVAWGGCWVRRWRERERGGG